MIATCEQSREDLRATLQRLKAAWAPYNTRQMSHRWFSAAVISTVLPNIVSILGSPWYDRIMHTHSTSLARCKAVLLFLSCKSMSVRGLGKFNLREESRKSLSLCCGKVSLRCFLKVFSNCKQNKPSCREKTNSFHSITKQIKNVYAARIQKNDR